MVELIHHGRGNLYTISEFGNLNNANENVEDSVEATRKNIEPIHNHSKNKKSSHKSKPIAKTKITTLSLKSVRAMYSSKELFDAILPFVESKAGGHMITVSAKNDIILRTMMKFSNFDEKLTEKEVNTYILSIKGEYTNAGRLDQKYQN